MAPTRGRRWASPKAHRASTTKSQAHRLFIEYYPAHLPGVPRNVKDRHESQLATNKHWIEWVDDGLSERADVGSKKARAALPASLR